MRKELFGIAATMLLVGTMALTSCSEDSTFGYEYEYDEEWDDLVPRTKQMITEPGINLNDYHKIQPGECSVAAMAYSRGQVKTIGGVDYVENSNYDAIVAILKRQEKGSAALTIEFQADVERDGGVFRTESQWKEIFGCDEIVQNSNFNFGTQKLENISWFGFRVLDGADHIDYIYEYIPASGRQPAKVRIGSYEKVNVSEFNIIYK